MAQNPSDALIFIPDISGFTNFVKENEIRHSQHILTDLLSIIIESNNLKLKISEIEGDAILFYRFGTKPTVIDLYDLSKSMFINFHKQLKKYRTNLICECGACSTAHKLSLKFIAHYGELSEFTVKNHTKLHGTALILAHRLLKNNILGSQYLLLTEELLTDQPDNAGISKILIKNHLEEFDDFGSLKTTYIPLDEESMNIPDPPLFEISPNFEKNPVTIKKQIAAPPDFSHSLLVDNSQKLHWVTGIKSIKNGDGPPQLGDSHQCIFDNLSFDIQFIYQNKTPTEKIFVERSSNVPFIGETISVFTIGRTKDNHTHLKLELHIPINNWRSRLLAPIVKFKFKKDFSKSLDTFKNFVETRYKEEEVLL